MKHYCVPTRTATVENATVLRVGQNKRQQEFSYTPGGCTNLHTLGKRVAILEKQHVSVPYELRLGTHPRMLESPKGRFTAALGKMGPNCQQPKWPFTLE